MQSEELFVDVDPAGALVFIGDEALRILACLGKATRRRASHVEPENIVLRAAFHALRRMFGDEGWAARWTRCWQCVWRVDMRPSGGPVLPAYFPERTAALRAERRWLGENL